MRKLVAFGVLLADGKQPHPRMADAQHVARVHVAHHGELDQVVGIAVDVGANVEQ